MSLAYFDALKEAYRGWANVERMPFDIDCKAKNIREDDSFFLEDVPPSSSNLPTPAEDVADTNNHQQLGQPGQEKLQITKSKVFYSCSS